MRKSKKFKTVFKILIIAFILCIAAVQMCIVGSIDRLTQKSNAEYLAGVSNAIEYELINKVDMLDRTAKTLSDSSNLQTYIMSENTKEREYARRMTEERMFEINTDLNQILGYIILDKDGTEMTVSNVEAQYAEKAEKNYERYKEEKLTNGIFFDISDGLLSIYKYKDVMYYNLDLAQVDLIGTLVTVDQINILELGMKLNVLESVGIRLVSKDEGKAELKLFTQNKKYSGRVISKTADITGTAWYTDIKMYDKNVSSDYMTILSADGVMVVIIVIFVTMFILMFYKMYTVPMRKVEKYLNNFSLGGKNEVLNDVGVEEVNDILSYINDMFDIMRSDAHKIVHTQGVLYEKEVEKQKILLYTYQMQIQPHFLYNTFGCINYFAIEYNAPEIIEITDSLTKILRYSVDSSAETRINDELSYIRWYMKIMMLRYPDKMELNIDVDDEVLELAVPGMILQPLVENAIKHGILPANRKCRIDVKGYSKGGYAYIEIIDNGAGMTEQQCAELNEKLKNYEIQSIETYNIGLTNVNKRIKLTFGNDCGCSVASEIDKFTDVKIKFKI